MGEDWAGPSTFSSSSQSWTAVNQSHRSHQAANLTNASRISNVDRQLINSWVAMRPFLQKDRQHLKYSAHTRHNRSRIMNVGPYSRWDAGGCIEFNFSFFSTLHHFKGWTQQLPTASSSPSSPSSTTTTIRPQSWLTRPSLSITAVRVSGADDFRSKQTLVLTQGLARRAHLLACSSRQSSSLALFFCCISHSLVFRRGFTITGLTVLETFCCMSTPRSSVWIYTWLQLNGLYPRPRLSTILLV